MRLLHLQLSRDVVQTAILAEVSPCLLEMERYVGCNALLTDAEHPGIIADTCITA